MDIKEKNSDVSVIICTKDAFETIEIVLNHIEKNNPLEIIVVDAGSTDGTREVVKKFDAKLITDPGKGLAYARNMGIEDARGKYIFFAGADNVMPLESLNKMKEYLVNNNYVGVGALTSLKDTSYLARGSNKRWESLVKEGPREVIGTPYLFIAEVLKKYKYDPKMTWSDDSDLGARLAKDGLKVAYSNVTCFEIGVETLPAIRQRFKMYGRSDFEYYHKYSSDWNMRRKIKSLAHPLVTEVINPLKSVKGIKKKIYFIPFFSFVMIFRYYGWIRSSINN